MSLFRHIILCQKNHNLTITHCCCLVSGTTVIKFRLGDMDNPVEAYTRIFNYPKESRIKSKEDLPKLGIKTFFCSNVCAAYRKSEYNALGGFPLHTIFNEDMIFASHLIEAGKKIAYAADAKVWHWHNYTAKDQLKRNFDLAVSQVDAGGLFTQVKSESEGIRLVKMTLRHFIKKGQFYYIPKIITQNGAKYIGYRLGKNYKNHSCNLHSPIFEKRCAMIPA